MALVNHVESCVNRVAKQKLGKGYSRFVDKMMNTIPMLICLECFLCYGQIGIKCLEIWRLIILASAVKFSISILFVETHLVLILKLFHIT